MKFWGLIFLISLNVNAVFSQLKIKTANGMVEGVMENSGVRTFKGIPFAAPPVGNLRWKDPQPAKNWSGVLKADHFGPRAMQPPIFSDMVFRSKGMSEDCLYLNIWAPPVTDKKLLPVLVYFYGGGFVAGDGSEPRYDGDSISHFGIVAITVNYRLGLFGFLAHPELSKESPHHSSGNYGVLDQSAALKWVKKNIAAFGGDPNRITIAGESAGSVSVSAQMTTPLSRNLIAGAIGESGSLLGTLRAISLEKAEKAGLEFGEKIGAKSLKDLRAMNADSLIDAATKFGPFRFSMTQDGYFFPKAPDDIFEAGEQANVPLLVGWNSEESGAGGILGKDSATLNNFKAAVNKLYGSNAADVLQAYAAASDEEVSAAATSLASDRFIGFSTWKWSDMQAKTGNKPVYRYLFERARPASGDEPKSQGAVHSAEIEYALGNLSTNKVFAWTEDDYKVSKIIQQYFVNFIKKGDPNGDSLPKWPAVQKNSPAQVMHIDVDTRIETEKFRDRYLLLDKIRKK